ncbi:MAG: SRPBCC family protein [Acidimicrobiia bacterium]|nr:SRPBCC family protein [Acidimicrobiia bacterium]
MATQLDITVERRMPVAAERIAAVMFDPAQDQTWMKALSGVDVLDQPVAIGARVRRHARFMGKDISWITVVRDYVPGRRLELDIAEGPFVGVVTYEITATGDSSSVVRIRNVGSPGQFAWMPGFLIRMAMRSSLAKDLRHLEAAATT